MAGLSPAGGGDGRQADGSYAFEIADITLPLEVRFTKQARIPEGASAGTIGSATLRGEIGSSPRLSLGGEGYKGFTPSAQDFCVGSQLYQYENTGAGAWITDIKFADVQGKGLVSPDRVDLRPASLGDVESGAVNTINVTAQDGRDITSEVMAGHAYKIANSAPPSAPAQDRSTVPGAPNQDLRQSSTWLDSVDFRYDSSTSTGTSWIPNGAKITLRRGVTYNNCVGGFATDFRSPRPLGVNIDIARTGLEKSDVAVASFTIPGEVVANDTCEGVYFNGGAGDAPLGVAEMGPGHITDITTRQVGAMPTDASKGDTLAMGTTGVFRDRLYFWAGKKGLMYYDLKATDANARVVDVNDQNGRVVLKNGSINEAPYSMAFDEAGTLWVVTRDLRLVSIVPPENPNGSATWKDSGQRINFSPAPPSSGLPNVYDFVFDTQGNMYMWVSRERAGDTANHPGSLYVMPASSTTAQLRGKAGAATAVGLAWGSDGKLVAAYGAKMFRIDPETGENLGSVNFERGKEPFWDDDPQYRQYDSIGDLASCFSSEPPSSGEPEFAVQKSALDPLSGMVTGAGEASTNHISVRKDGTFRAQYLVTVTMNGAATGTPPEIRDEVRFAEGIAIQGVQVKDLRTGQTSDAGTGGSFTLRPQELSDKRNSQSWLVTVDGKVPEAAYTKLGQVGECSTEGSGQGGRGLFNSVHMADDADGEENNDACIPIVPDTPPSSVTLEKKVNAEYGDIATNPEDERKFQLIISDARTNAVVGAGVSGETIRLHPGTYHLAESPTDSVAVGGFHLQSWTCNGQQIPDGILSIQDGEDVTCTADNLQRAKVHVEKFAGGADSTVHIGEQQMMDRSGKVDVTYTVAVTNDSSFPAKVGEITDAFQVPEGLAWRADESATVRVEGVEGQVKGLANSLSEDELRAGAVLASGIDRLQPGTMKFVITIPLQADGVQRSEQEQQLIEDHLAQCTAETFGDTAFAASGGGVLNSVNLAGENPEYAPLYYARDNVACVPVVHTPAVPGFHIEKQDSLGTPVDGAVFGLYDQMPVGGVAPIEIPQGVRAPGQQGAGVDPYKTPSRFFEVKTELTVGQSYWIKELKSPAENITLLPQPVEIRAKGPDEFVFIKDGQEISNSVDGGSFNFAGNMLTVKDPRMGELPKAGGMGHWLPAGVAVFLIMISLTVLFRQTLHVD